MHTANNVGLSAMHAGPLATLFYAIEMGRLENLLYQQTMRCGLSKTKKRNFVRNFERDG